MRSILKAEVWSRRQDNVNYIQCHRQEAEIAAYAEELNVSPNYLELTEDDVKNDYPSDVDCDD